MRRPSTDPSEFLAGLPTTRASVPGRKVTEREAIPKKAPFLKTAENVQAQKATTIDPARREQQRNYRYNRRQPNWMDHQRRERWLLLLMIVAGGAIVWGLIYLNLAK